MNSTAIAPDDRGWRFKLGMGLFVLMIVMGLTIPIIAVSGMPAGRIAALTGGIFIGNKILLVVIVAVMGKSGFQQLKQMLGSYLPSLKSDRPISPTRHVIGLIMFCLPIASAIWDPYLDMIAPGFRTGLWQIQLFADVMLVASIFVLGGNFWEKIRALFVRTARVVYPEDVAS